jgi:Lon protease-like protein
MTGRPSRFLVTDLPAVIPIFPLTDALLLPGGRLPLNIFEPRYVAMTADALAGDRIIGMVQPLDPDAETRDREPEVYATGCAGRITGFEESEDDRFEIDLTGLCRFEIARELPGVRGYRQVVARWDRFAGDLDDEDPGSIARGPLITALTEFLTPRGVETDWEAIDDLADAELVTWLAGSPCSARSGRARSRRCSNARTWPSARGCLRRSWKWRHMKGVTTSFRASEEGTKRR